MELSISRSKVAFILVAVIVFFWFAKGRQVVKDLPPEVRDVLPVPPEPDTASKPGRPAAAEPEPAPEPEPDPAPRPTKPAKPAATEAEAAPGQPPKPERTPDEKARSMIGVATAYAENGRYDKAYSTLEAAGKLEVSDAVKQEIAAAEATVTRLMKDRKTR